MRCGSGLVGGCARVLARVSRGHRVYGERADPFAAPGHHDVGDFVALLAVDAPAVQRPSDPHRQIALDHGALNGGHLPRVGCLVAERERGQLGPHCKYGEQPLNQRAAFPFTELPPEERKHSLQFEGGFQGRWDENRDGVKKVVKKRRERRGKEKASRGEKETRRRMYDLRVASSLSPPPSPRNAMIHTK